MIPLAFLAFVGSLFILYKVGSFVLSLNGLKAAVGGMYTLTKRCTCCIFMLFIFESFLFLSIIVPMTWGPIVMEKWSVLNKT